MSEEQNEELSLELINAKAEAASMACAHLIKIFEQRELLISGLLAGLKDMFPELIDEVNAQMMIAYDKAKEKADLAMAQSYAEMNKNPVENIVEFPGVKKQESDEPDVA